MIPFIIIIHVRFGLPNFLIYYVRFHLVPLTKLVLSNNHQLVLFQIDEEF